MSTQVLETLIHTHYPAAARGDRDAYGRIVAGCQRTVTSIALAIVRDVPASEDIAQEAFLSAWQNLRKLRNPASFLPWLRQITRNLARDHLRAQLHRANPGGDVEQVLASVADPHPGPAEQLACQQEHAAAADVIDLLPEDTREILLLYYREGQNSRQVASLLGIQDAAVRKRLSRARQQVRAELLHRFGEFAKSTAPGAGFTAAVAVALTMASPPAAAATALALGAMGSVKGAAKVGVGAMGAGAIGLVGGLAGIWLGIRGAIRQPFDQREKRELIIFGVVDSLIVIGFCVGITLMVRVPGWIPHMAMAAGFVVVICWTSMVWLPRILARRRQHAREVDPIASAEMESRARRFSRWGAALGLTLGTAGPLLGLYLSGRLG